MVLNLEETLRQYVDDDRLTTARKNAEIRGSKLTVEEWKLLRRLAKVDLWVLGHSILGYDRLTKSLHGDIIMWNRRTINEKYRGLLIPRGHLKTSIQTILDTIQIVLPDDTGEEPYPRNLGTDVRVCIVHETERVASSFLIQIASHFMSNEILMALFPECVPEPKKHRINVSELELPRPNKWSEATVTALGVGAKSQGRHFNFIKLDDLIGEKARESTVEMQTAKDWFDGVRSFFVKFKDDHFDLIGTRYSYDDLYNHAMLTYGDSIKWYVRSVEEKNANGELVPIFPEAISKDQIEQLKKNPKIWVQYSNKPEDIGNKFLPQWLRYYTWLRRNIAVIIEKNNLGFDIVRQINVMNDTDRCILIDPALSGSAGITITGTTSDEKILILEAIKGTFKPAELVDKIFEWVVRWEPRTVAIEEVLFSEVYRPWLEREMLFRGISFHITPIKVNNKSKQARIDGLSTFFANGKIYFNHSQRDLLEEFRRVGATTEDMHLLDSLAQGPKVWVPFFSQKKREEIRLNDEYRVKEIDKVTGYSII